LCYVSFKICWFHQKLFFEIARKPSVYAALSDVCVIITQASIRRTIPVAFIVLSPLQMLPRPGNSFSAARSSAALSVKAQVRFLQQ
jgi:hypothetical protein